MILGYEEINNLLHEVHPNLSDFWDTISHTGDGYRITYTLQDDSNHDVIIDSDRNVIVPDPILNEMKAMDI